MSSTLAAGLRQRPGLLLGAFALGCSALLGAGDLATRAEIRLRQAEDLAPRPRPDPLRRAPRQQPGRGHDHG